MSYHLSVALRATRKGLRMINRDKHLLSGEEDSTLLQICNPRLLCMVCEEKRQLIAEFVDMCIMLIIGQSCIRLAQFSLAERKSL